MKNRLYWGMLFFVVANFNLLYSDITIDGKGGSWDLLTKGSLTIPTGSKLTLKRTTVNKLSSSRLVVHNTISQLVLQNSTLSLDGNYSFTQGSLVIKGDCTITGTAGTLFTFNGHNILIDHGATLKVKNITFQAAPTARNRQLVKFGNETSQFLLEDATFKGNNAPTGLLRSGGLVMVGGNLVIEGSSIIDNSGTSSMHALQLGNAGYSSSDCRLVVRPNSKLTVKNAGVVFKNIGSGSLDLSGGSGTLDVDSATNANFLIETPVNLSNSTFNFDFSTLKGIERNIFYSLSNAVAEGDSGDDIYSVCWRPDGQYLSVGGKRGTGSYTYRIVGFDGSTFSDLPNSWVDHGAIIQSVSWNPDGRYLSAGGEQGTGSYTHRVYSFANNITTTLLGCNINHGGIVFSVSWSPDGRYLAIGGQQGTGNYTHRIYGFDGSSLTECTGCAKDHGGQTSVLWSPDGRYLAVGGVLVGVVTHRVYSFDGSNLTELINCRKNHGGAGVSEFSWSPDGKYLAIGGFDGTGGYEIRVYSFDGDSLSEILGCRIDNGAIVRAISWSPDGKFLSFGGVEVGGTRTHRVYSFDGSSLTELINCRKSHTEQVYSVAWYPDGRYLAIGGIQALDSMTHRVYSSQFTSSQVLVQFQNTTLNLGGREFKLRDVELRGS